VQGRGGRFVGAALTDQQRDFVQRFVANGGNGTKAAEGAGYSTPHVDAWRLRKNPKVAAAIHDEQKRIIGGELASLAVGVIRTILEAPDDHATITPKVKLDAAKTVLDRAGHIAPKAESAADPASERDLHAMSIAELEAFIDRAKREASDRATIVIDGQAERTDSPNDDDDMVQVIDLEGKSAV
jgi:phage terminase small subunit